LEHLEWNCLHTAVKEQHLCIYINESVYTWIRCFSGTGRTYILVWASLTWWRFTSLFTVCARTV